MQRPASTQTARRWPACRSAGSLAARSALVLSCRSLLCQADSLVLALSAELHLWQAFAAQHTAVRHKRHTASCSSVHAEPCLQASAAPHSICELFFLTARAAHLGYVKMVLDQPHNQRVRCTAPGDSAAALLPAALNFHTSRLGRRLQLMTVWLCSTTIACRSRYESRKLSCRGRGPASA